MSFWDICTKKAEYSTWPLTRSNICCFQEFLTLASIYWAQCGKVGVCCLVVMVVLLYHYLPFVGRTAPTIIIISAGREKCPFYVTFVFVFVWPDQAILITSFHLRCLIMTCGASEGDFDHSFPRKPSFSASST